GRTWTRSSATRKSAASPGTTRSSSMAWYCSSTSSWAGGAVRACTSSSAGISTGDIRSGGALAAWGGLAPPAGPSGCARRESPTRSGQITCQTRAARSLVNDRGVRCGPMKLGTSVRFLFPTSPATHERFRSLVASMPQGAFIERPMGAYTPEEQARNLMEVAAAARAAGLDGLLTGDSHGANPGYAATFSPLPTVARLMSVTGDMPIGVVLLAPFYHPVLLAEQLGTLAAFAGGPLIVTFVL